MENDNQIIINEEMEYDITYEVANNAFELIYSGFESVYIERDRKIQITILSRNDTFKMIQNITASDSKKHDHQVPPFIEDYEPGIQTKDSMLVLHIVVQPPLILQSAIKKSQNSLIKRETKLSDHTAKYQNTQTQSLEQSTIYYDFKTQVQVQPFQQKIYELSQQNNYDEQIDMLRSHKREREKIQQKILQDEQDKQKQQGKVTNLFKNFTYDFEGNVINQKIDSNINIKKNTIDCSYQISDKQKQKLIKKKTIDDTAKLTSRAQSLHENKIVNKKVELMKQLMNNKISEDQLNYDNQGQRQTTLMKHISVHENVTYKEVNNGSIETLNNPRSQYKSQIKYSDYQNMISRNNSIDIDNSLIKNNSSISQKQQSLMIIEYSQISDFPNVAQKPHLPPLIQQRWKRINSIRNNGQLRWQKLKLIKNE